MPKQLQFYDCEHMKSKQTRWKQQTWMRWTMQRPSCRPAKYQNQVIMPTQRLLSERHAEWMSPQYLSNAAAEVNKCLPIHIAFICATWIMTYWCTITNSSKKAHRSVWKRERVLIRRRSVDWNHVKSDAKTFGAGHLPEIFVLSQQLWPSYDFVVAFLHEN